MKTIALILLISFTGCGPLPVDDTLWDVTDSCGNVHKKLKRVGYRSDHYTNFQDSNGKDYIFKGNHSYIEAKP